MGGFYCILFEAATDFKPVEEFPLRPGKTKDFPDNAYMQCRDISLVMKLLNHSCEAITLSYIGITKEDMDKVYLNLNL